SIWTWSSLTWTRRPTRSRGSGVTGSNRARRASWRATRGASWPTPRETNSTSCWGVRPDEAAAPGGNPAPRSRTRRAVAGVPRDATSRRGGRVRLDLGRQPPALPRQRETRARSLGSLDDPGRPGRRDGARLARTTRRLRRLRAARHPREDGVHDRCD